MAWIRSMDQCNLSQISVNALCAHYLILPGMTFNMLYNECIIYIFRQIHCRSKAVAFPLNVFISFNVDIDPTEETTCKSIWIARRKRRKGCVIVERRGFGFNHIFNHKRLTVIQDIHTFIIWSPKGLSLLFLSIPIRFPPSLPLVSSGWNITWFLIITETPPSL